MKQNITISLDKELIRKAKLLAAKRETSVSRMLSHELEKAVQDAEKYEVARQRALAILRNPFHLGGQAPCSREELHAR